MLRIKIAAKLNMEKEAILVSRGETISVIEEECPPHSTTSISSSCNPDPSSVARKRTRNSRFKGVVPHPNGNWGSQIYADHLRLWLGTFRTEEEAAVGYDRGALKLRTNERLRGPRNLPLNQILTVQELNFQNCYTTEAVIDMIRDGSYQVKFDDFRNRCSLVKSERREELDLGVKDEEWRFEINNNNYIRCKRLLFQKDLTPSDVGKLNRVVIPKKCAVKFFPRISEEGGVGGDDVQVRFYDRNMKLWKFRYCYWRSSHSYVFTRGWNKFVKDKGLEANDTVAFSLCENIGNNPLFFLIDVINNNNSNGLGEVREVKVDMGLELKLGFGQKMEDHQSKVGAEKKGFKLFGVQIWV